MIFYSTGYIWYDDPENDKQKWKVHKDDNEICFESVKWPNYYLTYNDEYYHCCNRNVDNSYNCTAIFDTRFSNWLCTACNSISRSVKTCWRASIFEENAIIPPRQNCDLILFNSKL